MARPRKKRVTTVEKRAKRTDIFSSPRSYISLLYGAVTVIVLFVLLFFGLRMLSQRNPGTVGENGVQTQQLQKIYAVQEGDTLWSIAETQYKDGHMWTEIAKANQLTNPNDIERGMKLTIPPSTTTSTTTSPSSAVTGVTAIATPSVLPSPTLTPAMTRAPSTTPSPSISTSPSPTGQGQKISGATYTVVEGDNLWTIAIRAYGDGYKWTDIARVNNLQNPDLIYPGNKFTLPR